MRAVARAYCVELVGVSFVLCKPLRVPEAERVTRPRGRARTHSADQHRGIGKVARGSHALRRGETAAVTLLLVRTGPGPYRRVDRAKSTTRIQSLERGRVISGSAAPYVPVTNSKPCSAGIGKGQCRGSVGAVQGQCRGTL